MLYYLIKMIVRSKRKWYAFKLMRTDDFSPIKKGDMFFLLSFDDVESCDYKGQMVILLRHNGELISSWWANSDKKRGVDRALEIVFEELS